MNDSPGGSRGRGEFLKKLFLTILFVAGALLVWHTLQIFLLIFAGTIFAIFLRRTGQWISNHSRLSIQWSVSIVLLVLLALTILLSGLMAPRIMEQTDKFSSQFPEAISDIKERVSDYTWGQWFLSRMSGGAGKTETNGGMFQNFGGIVGQATGWMFSFVGGLTGILIILAIGLYLAYDADLYLGGVRKLIPKNKRDRGRRVLHGVGATLYWWLIGRLVSMLIIAVLTVIGLSLMGIPLALTLAVFAGLMTFIPNIGPLVSVIPAMILALPEGWGQAGYVALLYMGIQTVESYFVTPMVQRQIISMPPALILSAQLIMGMIQGVFGILLATPLVAAVMVAVKLIYIEDNLHDGDVTIPAEDLEENHSMSMSSAP